MSPPHAGSAAAGSPTVFRCFVPPERLACPCLPDTSRRRALLGWLAFRGCEHHSQLPPTSFVIILLKRPFGVEQILEPSYLLAGRNFTELCLLLNRRLP